MRKFCLYKILIEVTNQLSNTTVYSQQQHLDKLMDLKQSNHLRAQKLMRDYAYQTLARIS